VAKNNTASSDVALLRCVRSLWLYIITKFPVNTHVVYIYICIRIHLYIDMFNNILRLKLSAYAW
jgi:hypothetical protein